MAKKRRNFWNHEQGNNSFPTETGDPLMAHARAMRKKRINIETYLFIAGGLISMAGVQAQIFSAEEESAAYVTSQPIEKGKAPGM